MNLKAAIAALEAHCTDPRSGLPEEVFLLLTRLTPMANVDLLIKDDAGRTLLTWREDIYHGAGWHIPGGVIRLKETAAHRIAAVARLELGCDLTAEDYPTAINECISETQTNRGHAVSLLYRCTLISKPSAALRYSGGKPHPGMYHYFDRAPDNLLKVHQMYRKYIGPQTR
jgi:ADP-ribose pyrophosphatase YjhB (NUDIX family)